MPVTSGDLVRLLVAQNSLASSGAAESGSVPDLPKPDGDSGTAAAPPANVPARVPPLAGAEEPAAETQRPSSALTVAPTCATEGLACTARPTVAEDKRLRPLLPLPPRAWLAHVPEPYRADTCAWHAAASAAPLPAAASAEAREFHGPQPNPSTLVKTPQREAFACQLDAARPQVNHNALLVDEFVKLEKLASASGEPRYKYRALQYARQANILRQLDFPVKSSEDVRGMRYMGESCRAKIAEILETRSLRKREFMEHDERNEALRALTSVWGIGNATAQGLLAKGIRSLAMLERAAARGEVVLDERQQAGLRHHADLSERIDSAEVKALGRVVQEAARRAYPDARDLVAEIAGSYRRGAKSSGDVDVILTDLKRARVLRLAPIVNELVRTGFMIAHPLFEPDVPNTARGVPRSDGEQDSSMDDDDPVVLQGQGATRDIGESESVFAICRLPGGKARRVDIKCFPSDNFAFAILYFTGSAHFNRSMRHWARQHDFSLSEKALYPVVRAADGSAAVLCKGSPIRCSTEREIFHKLGLEYREPSERNCAILNWRDASAHALCPQHEGGQEEEEGYVTP